MPKDEAMRNYVDILKQVVETMTLDSNVQDFLEKVGPIYEFVTDDGRVVSKNADINSFRPDGDAMAMLGLAKTGQKLLNGTFSYLFPIVLFLSLFGFRKSRYGEETYQRQCRLEWCCR